MALPSANESPGGLSLTSATGAGVPAVTVSAGVTSVSPEQRPGPADRGRTGGRLFPLAGRKNSAERGDHTLAEEDSAAGTSVAGLRAASLAATQTGRTTATGTSAPGSRAGRPLFVAAAIAGAVLAAVPFVHGKGGTVNYEGLGKARPLADLPPDADNSNAILHPDGRTHALPLLDPAEGFDTEPFVPQPENGSYPSGGAQDDLTLPGAAAAQGGPATEAHVLSAPHRGPGPVSPLTPGAAGTADSHPVAAHTNTLLFGGGAGAASGLIRSNELKGDRKTPDSAAGSGTSRVAVTPPSAGSLTPSIVAASDEQGAAGTTTTARVATFAAPPTVEPDPVTTVTLDETPTTMTARIASVPISPAVPSVPATTVVQDDAPGTTVAARVAVVTPPPTVPVADQAPPADGPQADDTAPATTDGSTQPADTPLTGDTTPATPDNTPPVTETPQTDDTVPATTEDTAPPAAEPVTDTTPADTTPAVDDGGVVTPPATTAASTTTP